MLEVNAISVYHISVILEHPYEESMATVEFDLSNLTNIACHVYTLNSTYDGIATKLSRIVQRSLSIPITIRALLKFWEQERLKGFQQNMDNGNFNLIMGPNDPGGRNEEFREMKAKNDRNLCGNFSNNARQFFHTSGVMMMPNSNLPMFDSSGSSGMINQFQNPLKIHKNITFQQHKKDFYKSPKRNLDSFEADDSNSLGVSMANSDIGVTASTSKQYDEGKQSQTMNILGTDNDNIRASQTSSERCMNITSLPNSYDFKSSVSAEMVLDKRPGIEIIPINSSSNSNVQSSISITQINSSKSEKKKSSAKKSDDKTKTDKKRKRKKDDLPMGPPEKMISKQGLPYTIKGDSSPNKKQSHSQSLVPNNRSIPNLKPNLGTASPKHSSTLSTSGKPSMSALKIVTNSPKHEKSLLKLQSRDKDKEKSPRRLNHSSSPKMKGSVKLKQFNLSTNLLNQLEQSSKAEDGKTSTINSPMPEDLMLQSNSSSSILGIQQKVRKGSLSAVIDKLKSAQYTSDEALPVINKSTQKGENQTDNSNVQNPNFKTSMANTNFNSEYMIKPSLDGMKITINKTRTKDTLQSKVSSPPISSNTALKFPTPSGSGSPKRNLTVGQKSSYSSSTSKKSGILQPPSKSFQTSTMGRGFPKSNSFGGTSGRNSEFGGSSLSKTSDTIRKEKSKTKNLSSDKQTNSRVDPMEVMKILRFATPNSSIDGFIKSFQIPKLSARSGDDSKKDAISNINQTPTSNTSTSPSVISASTAATSSSTNIASPLSINNNSNSNSSDSGKFTTDSIPKDLSSKVPISTINKAMPESNFNNFEKLSQFFPSTSPKYTHDTNMFSKDLGQLSKSSSSDAILSNFQRDFSTRPHSLSTPSTPMHIPSPFTSPIGGLVSMVSPIHRASPSTSPSISQGQGGSDDSNSNSLMRPPSAPSAIDLIKGTEMDLSFNKLENKFSIDQQQQQNRLASNQVMSNASSFIRKLKQSSDQQYQNRVSSNQILANATSLMRKLNSKYTPSTLADQQEQQQMRTTSKPTLNNTSASTSTSSSSFSAQGQSVSLHIVKSPVPPSPLMTTIQSPHSSSTCVNDDEILEETLVRIEGK